MMLVVDAERWLVLAEQIRDFEGTQRFEWHFDTIEFDPDESPDEWPEGSGHAVQGAGAVAEPAPGAIRPGELPEGFAHLERRVWGEDGVEDVYSDGLAAIVIRQRAAPLAAAVEDGELSCRSCSGRSEVSGTFSGVEVSILGNVPVDELEALASSLHVGP